jgi:copper ion binding protein
MNNKVAFNVKGMSCGGCVNSIESTTRALVGVSSSHVDFSTGKAMIEYDDTKTTSAAIQKAIKNIGYEATPTNQTMTDQPSNQPSRKGCCS